MTAFLAPLILTLALQAKVTAPGPPPPPAPNKVVITVNGHPILAKELEPYLWDWKASEAGQTLIDDALINEAAKAKGVAVTNEEVNKEYQDTLLKVEAQLNTKDLQVVRKALQEKGVDLSFLTLKIRQKLLLDKLVALDFNANNFVKVSTIVVQPKTPSSADTQAALTAVSAAYDELQKGVVWDAVLQKYTTAQQTAVNHGELNWVPIDAFPATTKTEFTGLKLMGFAKPVQINSAFQIFRLEARGKDATPQEMAMIKAKYLEGAEGQLYQKLHNAAKIDTSF